MKFLSYLEFLLPYACPIFDTKLTLYYSSSGFKVMPLDPESRSLI